MLTIFCRYQLHSVDTEYKMVSILSRLVDVLPGDRGVKVGCTWVAYIHQQEALIECIGFKHTYIVFLCPINFYIYFLSLLTNWVLRMIIGLHRYYTWCQVKSFGFFQTKNVTPEGCAVVKLLARLIAQYVTKFSS